MPYVVTTFVGSTAGGAAPPSTIVRNTDGSIRASAVGTSDTCVAPTPSTSTGSNAGSTVREVPITIARVTTLSPPTWDSGRQASQWSSWVTSRRVHVAAADARTA